MSEELSGWVVPAWAEPLSPAPHYFTVVSSGRGEHGNSLCGKFTWDEAAESEESLFDMLATTPEQFHHPACDECVRVLARSKQR
jgi:hypothetical protein